MTIKKTITSTLAAGIASLGLLAPAVAQDNATYGDTRVNELPARGMAAHAIWVGSWWAYSRDGVAYRHKLRGGFPECTGVTAEQAPQAVVDAGKAFCLSAAEKVDYLAGRLGDIEWDKIAEYQRITQDDLGSLQERIRELVRLLNKWIGENPGQDWRETDNGREYLAKKMELETAQANLPAITIDTATEFERINHGNGVPGVGSWWGHCNAWSAAALMEDEPKVRGAVTQNGVSVEFTPGEAKALLTEVWMEHQSSFHGARHDDPENTGLHYEDLTPAAFHVFFGTQLGQKQKGFVIDRFTGSEVWNQPVRSYVSRYEKLYQGDTAEKIELFQTTYNRSTGEPEKRSLGERDVFPVQYTTTFHWVTDGLPHEAVTVDNILAPEWPTDSGRLHSLWNNQVEMRTLTYTLYLDKPIEDASARIIGDGAWDGAVAGSNHAWPDFAWQPLAQTPSRRDYENPLINPGDIVHSLIVPATAAPVPVDAASVEITANDLPLDIPDNDPTGVVSTVVSDAPGIIRAAEVTVDITHTYRGDLKVVLAKDGSPVVLADQEGGSADDLKKTFTIHEFDGQAAAGTWTLTVVDSAGQDVGTINAWSVSLQIEGGEPVDPPAGGEGTFAAEGLPLDIPDNAPAGVTSRLSVGEAGRIKTLKVKVDITHTYQGDLLVVLQKGARSITLHNRTGRSADDIKKTFDVDALNGEEIRGDWQLKVSDHASRDVGKINAWSLEASWE
ncbi:MAG: proprotein convertase P-domain-containing protein [Myxococcales bacterium]|nr:proprotein convertase P-domain-containing protein [Myxococcales bacterium]